MADVMEHGNHVVALTAMGQEFGAAAARRVNAADQLSNDAQRMWTINMTTPSNMAALALRTVHESDSGRARRLAPDPNAG